MRLATRGGSMPIELASALEVAARYLPELALKSTLVLGVAWVLAFLLRRRSAAVRHLVWTTAVAGVLALPFLQLIPLRLAVLPPSFAGASAQVARAGDAPASVTLAQPVEEVTPAPEERAADAPVAWGWRSPGVDRTTAIVGVWL